MALDARFLLAVVMRLNRGHVLFFMTFEADLPSTFTQQAWLFCLMRIVTGTAFAIGDRVMFVGGRAYLFLELVMALVTQVPNRFRQQLLIL